MAGLHSSQLESPLSALHCDRLRNQASRRPGDMTYRDWRYESSILVQWQIGFCQWNFRPSELGNLGNRRAHSWKVRQDGPEPRGSPLRGRGRFEKPPAITGKVRLGRKTHSMGLPVRPSKRPGVVLDWGGQCIGSPMAVPFVVSDIGHTKKETLLGPPREPNHTRERTTLDPLDSPACGGEEREAIEAQPAVM